MRVGIIALQHESNTFLKRPTTLEDFREQVLATGEALRQHYAGGHHEVGGFFAGLEAQGVEAVPIFAASATPGGMVTGDAYAALLKAILLGLEEAGRLDGLLLAPHGAGVCEAALDMDGQWMSAVREHIGAAMPMVATIDPHANLSAQMVAACQGGGGAGAIIPYRTNPHIDQRARGIEAARLLVRTLRGEVRPLMAAAFPPVAINIACQHTEAPPCRELAALADEQLRRKGVLANGVVLGFPYADVAEMGSSFIAVTDGDAALAQRLADELADYLIMHRQDFVARLPGVEEAVDQALHSPAPVCLLDLGDNVGGGSPGDGTLIAESLQRRKVTGLVCLCDAAAAEKATHLGAGAVFAGTIGGRTDALHGPPLEVTGRVVRLHDGKFEEAEVRHGGQRHFAMGASAVIEAAGGRGGVGGLTILVHSLRTPPFSLQQLVCCGLDVARFQVVVAKGVNAPLAAYAPVCPTIIRVDTPGVTTAGMTRLAFDRRRRPLFPFEEIDGDTKSRSDEGPRRR